MPAHWTGTLIGEMHLKGVTQKDLARAMGVTPEYVSMVLNGHRKPKNAEKDFFNALNKAVSEQTPK